MPNTRQWHTTIVYLQDRSWPFPERLGFAPLGQPLKTVAVGLSLSLDQYQLHSLGLCLDVPVDWVPKHAVYAYVRCTLFIYFLVNN